MSNKRLDEIERNFETSLKATNLIAEKLISWQDKIENRLDALEDMEEYKDLCAKFARLLKQSKATKKPEPTDEEWLGVADQAMAEVYDETIPAGELIRLTVEVLAKQVVTERKRADDWRKHFRMESKRADASDTLRHERDALQAVVERLKEQASRLVADGIEGLTEEDMRRLFGSENVDAEAEIGSFVARHAIAKVDDKDRIALLERLLREVCEQKTPIRDWACILKEAFGDDA